MLEVTGRAQYLVFLLALLLLIASEASASHCYILRSVSETQAQITLNWMSIFLVQGPTPRAPQGYTITGGWPSRTTPGGMDSGKCSQMVTDKARRDAIAWPNPGYKCTRSYYNSTLVYTHPTRCTGTDGDQTPAPRISYKMRGGFACYGGAEYPESWRSEASCVDFGCNFGNLSLEMCLALGIQKGARQVIHGNTGGSRSDECWLQHSCVNLQPNSEFSDYRSDEVPPPPPPISGYVNRGAYACFSGAEYPASWKNEASCGSYGCNFGKLSLEKCLTRGAQKGAGEVIHGNTGGGRSDECWLQNSCTDLRPHSEFTLFRP